MRPFAWASRFVTTTGGIPLLKVFQVVPLLVERNTPMSVPTYNVVALSGSISKALVGISGRLLLRLVQFAPVFVVNQTWPEP